VLKAHLPRCVIDACRGAFLPTLCEYLENQEHQPNRGAQRHFLPIPFDPPCFAPEFGTEIFTAAVQWTCE
jgi:hypothetical protein